MLFNALSRADTDNYLFNRLFLLIKVLQIWKKLFYTLSAKIVWKLNKLNAKPNHINNSLKFLTSLSALKSL